MDGVLLHSEHSVFGDDGFLYFTHCLYLRFLVRPARIVWPACKVCSLLASKCKLLSTTCPSSTVTLCSFFQTPLIRGVRDREDTEPRSSEVAVRLK